MWDSIWHDVRTAVRSLVRRRFFSAAGLVLLALGIGGATTICTLVDGVLIRNLPYKDPASLVNVWRAWPSWQGQGVLEGDRIKRRYCSAPLGRGLAAWGHWPDADATRIRWEECRETSMRS